VNASEQESKVVLITGASKRIGASVCKKFHENGFKVIIHYNQSSKEALRLAEDLNSIRLESAATVNKDLSSENQVISLAQEAMECFGAIDVLINNASSFFPTPLGSVTSNQWHELLDLNLKAAFFLAQALSLPIQERKGAIVNLVDIYANKPLKHYPAYSISKAGVQAMTRALAIELAPTVRVNGVSPGAIIWPSESGSTQSEVSKKEIINNIPLGKTGSPSDIADAVFFLAVKATYITGEVLRVDGGRALNL